MSACGQIGPSSLTIRAYKLIGQNPAELLQDYLGRLPEQPTSQAVWTPVVDLGYEQRPVISDDDPPTQIVAGLEQRVMLTRVTFGNWDGGRSTNTTAHA
jgi:hypothetical protein